ncbi:unnamed protein product, partial [marine sediment metagenome]
SSPIPVAVGSKKIVGSKQEAESSKPKMQDEKCKVKNAKWKNS